MTRVWIASRSPVVRAGLESLVAAGHGLEVVGTSAGADAALALRTDEAPADVLLIEVSEGDEEALAALLGDGEGTRTPVVIILSEDPQGSQVREALRAGALSLLPRGATGEEILAAVHAAAAGLVALPPVLIETLLSGASAPAQAPPEGPHESLTPREVEVLGMIAEGYGNKTIAYRLGISEHTVKFHVASILSKLGAASRTEAVTTGIRRGLIML